MNFSYSVDIADFSWSIEPLANPPKLCWKYFIVSRKKILLPMFAKLISVGLFQPMFRSLVLQTPALSYFNKKKKTNLKRLWATNVILDLFSVTFALKKLYAYPIISPQMCKWCMFYCSLFLTNSQWNF